MSHCLTINLAYYGIQVMKLYDEMPTHVLADYKTIGDSTVFLRHDYPLASFGRKTW